MDVHAHLDQLAGDEPARQAAADALVAAGRPAVAPLVDALCAAVIDPDVTAAVLRRIGPVAYPPLVRALARADGAEVARRVCDALGMAVADADKAVSAAAEVCADDSAEREDFARTFGFHQSLEHAPLLAVLLADPDPYVFWTAVNAFGQLGPAAVPLLRGVRRARVPQRRGALAALAEIGWDTLDPVDRAVVRRFVDRGIAAETPEPFPVAGEWFAVRTRDQEAVLAAFDLSDPVPVTVRMGTLPWWLEHDFPFGSDVDQHASCARMFVSPVLDGWTLVFGEIVREPDLDTHDTAVAAEWSGRDEEDEESWRYESAMRMRDVVADLSRRFGAAHWYREEYGGGCGDATAWCFAEDGVETRFYSHDFEVGEKQTGTPAPAEEGLRPVDEDTADWLERHGFPRDLWLDVMMLAPEDARDLEERAWWNEQVARIQQGTNMPPRRTATAVAARASVGPGAWGPETHVEGHGVLALTACGRRRGHRGALLR